MKFAGYPMQVIYSSYIEVEHGKKGCFKSGSNKKTLHYPVKTANEHTEYVDNNEGQATTM